METSTTVGEHTKAKGMDTGTAVAAAAVAHKLRGEKT